MRQPTRSRSKRTHKDVLATMQKTHKLSADGKAWLIQSLDPFHDTPISPTGYPDVDSSATVAYCIASSLTISPPAGITSTQTWDAHIFNSPDLIGNAHFTFSNLYTNTINASATSNILGVDSVTAWTALSPASGGPAQMVPLGANNSAFTGVTKAGLNLPAVHTAGNSRVVGWGFEVENTSSELNTSGLVTVYRQPQTVTNTAAIFTSTNNNQTFVNPVCFASRLPPMTVAEALGLDGSVQWLASDGVYAVCSQFTVDNPLQQAQVGNRKYSTISSAGTESGLINANIISEAVSTSVANTYNGNLNGIKTAPYNTSGAYFTGLGYQATLNVTVRWYVERSPTSEDSVIAAMANPSPAYDPQAFKCYSAALAHLPVAVPYGENPLGEWFKKVLTAVSEYGGIGATLLAPINQEAALFAKMASIAAKAVAGSWANKEKILQKLENKVNTVEQKVAAKKNVQVKKK